MPQRKKSSAARSMTKKTKAKALRPNNSGPVPVNLKSTGGPNTHNYVSTLPSTMALTPRSNCYKFRPGSSPATLLMDCSFPLFGVGGNFVFSVNETVLLSRLATQINYGFLAPHDADQLASFPKYLGDAFTKYRYRGKVTFTYLPTAIGTNSAIQLVFGASDDSQHPLIITPTAESLVAAGGFAFPIWMPWQYSLDMSRDDWHYSAAYSNTVAANNRDAYAGAFAMVTSTVVTLSGAVGQLWCDCTIELAEPNPITTTISVAMPKRKEAGHEEDQKSAVVPGGYRVINATTGQIDDYIVPDESEDLSPPPLSRCPSSVKDPGPPLAVSYSEGLARRLGLSSQESTPRAVSKIGSLKSSPGSG